MKVEVEKMLCEWIWRDLMRSFLQERLSKLLEVELLPKNRYFCGFSTLQTEFNIIREVEKLVSRSIFDAEHNGSGENAVRIEEVGKKFCFRTIWR